MSLFKTLQELLFPSRCLACQVYLGRYRLPLLCADCRASLSSITSPLCPCCGRPYLSGVNHHCGECLSSRVPYDCARASFLYQEPLTSLIVQWKFGGRLTGIATMAALVADSEAVRDISTPDLVLPVPLHKTRLRKRGFNQALQLAANCFPDWKDRIVGDGLKRLRPTIPQVRLSGSARRKNLKGAFSLKQRHLVAGKTVLLVDDVVTTGSTVRECCKVLRAGGAHRIEVFTLARSL